MASLFIVATPIGNLEDITLRALETLKKVDLIVCEDTRHTRKLLSHYNIHKPLRSYNQHSGPAKLKALIDDFAAGKDAAYVTDAGTPGISDPGGQLVAAATRAGVNVVTIPGASAVTASLSVSGFPTDRFSFLGYMPHKKGRRAFLERVLQITDSRQTVAFFESTHRICKLLDELEQILEPNRELIVAREITKKHETIYRGTISEIKDQIKETRGEFTIVIAPTP